MNSRSLRLEWLRCSPMLAVSSSDSWFHEDGGGRRVSFMQYFTKFKDDYVNVVALSLTSFAKGQAEGGEGGRQAGGGGGVGGWRIARAEAGRRMGVGSDPPAFLH